MSHQIDVESFQSWLDDNPHVTYAASSKEPKELRATASGHIEVYHKGKKVWEGYDVATGVKEYNKIGI